MGKKSMSIGKEYELSNSVRWTVDTRRDRKEYDGSGPAEVSLGVYRAPYEAIVGEILLIERLGTRPLMDYYTTDDDDEQKGNHLHLGFSRESFDVARISLLLFRKLYTLGNRFRNTVRKWARVPPQSYRDAYHSVLCRSREYAAVTGNGRSGKATVEIRVSEGLVVLDLVAIALAMGVYSMLREHRTAEEITDMLDTYPYDGSVLIYGANDIHGTAYDTIVEALRASGIDPTRIPDVLEGEWRYLANEGVSWILGHYNKYDLARRIYAHVARHASAKEIRHAISVVNRAFGWNTRGIRALAGQLRVLSF